MKDVAVIIINFNTATYTLECVEKVIEQTGDDISYEIIVVDNNSEPEDFYRLQEGLNKYTDIRLERSVINTGFGGGNMFGAQFADSKYLLFLNNDAFLLNDCLQILFSYMESHREVGVATAQNYNEQGQFVPSFDHNKGLRRLLFGRGFLERSHPERYPERKRKYADSVTADWLNGAFLFFRATSFSEIGGFDTNIFLYWEEMDLGFRLRKSGYRCDLVPVAKIGHYQGVSIGKSREINKESYISYLYVVQKHYGTVKYLLIRLYLCLAMAVKPKKWYLIPTIWNGGSLSESLKHRQKVRYL